MVLVHAGRLGNSRFRSRGVTSGKIESATLGQKQNKMASWPAQGLKFSGLQHPPSENAIFAIAPKSSKSIDDSSNKLDFLPFCKIVVSVGDDTPSAKMTFLQLPTARCC